MASVLLGVWLAAWAAIRLGYVQRPPFDLLMGLFLLTILIIVVVREKVY